MPFDTKAARRKVMLAELRRRGVIELPALGQRLQRVTDYYVKEARFRSYMRQMRRMLDATCEK